MLIIIKIIYTPVRLYTKGLTGLIVDPAFLEIKLYHFGFKKAIKIHCAD